MNNEAFVDNKITIEKTADAKVLLTLVELKEESATIRLTDNAGQLLFSKNIKNKVDYGLSLDLSKLEDGAYTIEVDRKDRMYTNLVTVKNGDIQLSTIEMIFKPVIETTETGFSVTNPSAIVNMVSILNEQSDVVYTKNYTEDNKYKMNYTANYSLQNLTTGTYIAKVETTNGAYFKTISVK